MKSRQPDSVSALVVGLDSSTTAVKAIAFDRSGRIAAQAHHPISLFSPQPRHYEQDPADWWHAAQQTLQSITAQADPARIRALAVSNQRETFVPLAAAGAPLRPAIIWLDERCKEEVAPFAARIGEKAIHRITGKPLDYAPVVYRLAWMKRHESKLFKRIAMVCDVQSYLVHQLTGLHATSWASADPLGLLEMRYKRWSPLILEALGLRNDQLPHLFSPGTVIGTVTTEAAAATGLASGTLIVAGGGDGQAAGLGANVLASETAYLNLGTAIVAGVYGARYRTNKAFRTLCSCSREGYYFESSLRAGAFAVDWLMRSVFGLEAGQPGIYQELEELAMRVPPGSDGVMFLPHLCGVMNPYWDPAARGGFTGLAASHTRGHLYRAVLEGIAFEQRLAIESIEKVLGARVEAFAAMGGGTASPLWCAIMADVTGRELRIPENSETSTLGAAVMAAMGAGWFSSFREAAARMSRVGKIIKPSQRRQQIYASLYPLYTRLYPAHKQLQLQH
jgi:xylulokinase